MRYENQSDALNRCFADIFGAMVDRDDWTVGEDLNLVFAVCRILQDLAIQPIWMILENGRCLETGVVCIQIVVFPIEHTICSPKGLTLEGLGSSIGKDKAEKRGLQYDGQSHEDSDFQAAAAVMLTSAEARYGEESLKASPLSQRLNVGIFLILLKDDDSPVGSRKRNIPSFRGHVFIALYPRTGTCTTLGTIF